MSGHGTSANMCDTGSTFAYMGLLGYVIPDSGTYSDIGYPDIRIPFEITSLHYKVLFIEFTLIYTGFDISILFDDLATPNMYNWFINIQYYCICWKNTLLKFEL